MDDKNQKNSPEENEQAAPQRLTLPEKRNSAEEQTVNDIAQQEETDRLRLQTNEDFEVPYDPPKKQRKILRKLLHFLGWMLLIVVLTGGAAGAAWYFWLSKEQKTTPSSSQQETPAPSPQPAAEEEEPTETHTSSAFQLQFDYPQGWKVTEGVDNKIVAVSPATQLKTVAGSKQTGQIVMIVQRKQVSLPDFAAGSALAVRESEKIDYKKPSQVQRASTYLSFPSYAASASKGIDGVYITGDNGYQKNQYIPMSDIAKSDPLIMVTFRSCDDDKCATAGKPLTLAASVWDDAAFSKPIKSILQSIVVQ